jgi:myo-inositol-1(or 4)-monophosphatase
MTPPVDLEFCATALRTITNDIARTRAQPDPAADLAALIGDLRRLNTETSAKMRAALTACYPNIRWTAAEAGEAICPANQMTWIYDPIDGAYHYLQGMPLWSSSLALVQGAQTLAAFVYDPALDQMFLASEGGPAKLNGDDLRVSGKPSLSTAVIAIPPFVAVKLDEFQLALTTLAAVTPQT